MVSIAEDIYVWRVVNRLSQADAAAIAGVSAKTWARWERSESYPKQDHYDSLRWIISRPAFGVPADA
jgi:transcriptional regulator with XRE-family HTH domain